LGGSSELADPCNDTSGPLFFTFVEKALASYSHTTSYENSWQELSQQHKLSFSIILPSYVAPPGSVPNPKAYAPKGLRVTVKSSSVQLRSHVVGADVGADVGALELSFSSSKVSKLGGIVGVEPFDPLLQGLSAAVFTDYFHMIFNLMMIKNGTSNKRSENGIQQNLTGSN